MKKYYRWMALAIVLILLLVTAGCGDSGGSTDAPAEEGEPSAQAASQEAAGGEAAGGGTYVIGAISDGLASPYQQGHYAWLEQLAAELGHQVVVLDGQVDPQTKMNHCETLITRGVSAVTVQANDMAGADSLIKECHDAGVPIVNFYMPSENETAPAVVIDEYATSFSLGTIAAEKWMGWYPDTPIKVGILDLPTSSRVHEGRSLAFWDGVQSVAPDAELVSMLDGGSVRDLSFKAAQDMLQAHPEVNIVYGINSESSLGALAAFEEAGRGKAEDGVPLTELFVGTNGSEVEAEKLYDPGSAFKLTQALQPRANAEAVLDTILKVLDGEIAMEDDLVVEAFNVVFTYWDSPIEEYEQFMVDEYLSEPGFAARMEEYLNS